MNNFDISGFITRMLSYSRTRQKGSVVLLGLMVAAVFGVMSAAFITNVVSERRLSERSNFTTINAMNVAEAGLEHGIWEFRYGDANFSGWQAVSGGVQKSAVLQTNAGIAQGEYVVAISGLPDNPVIVSTGFVPDQANSIARATVQAAIIRKPIFTVAIGGLESITIEPNSLFDAYNSDDGDYDPANAENYEITITCGGDIDVGNNTIIHGTVESNNDDFDAPSIPALSGLSGALDVDNTTGDVTLTSDASYDTVTIDKKKLIIDGDVILRVNTLDIQGSNPANGVIEIKNDAKLTLVVNSSFNAGTHTQINTLSADPKRMIIYGTETCGSINFQPNGDFYGVIYAPDSNINFQPGGDIFGAVIGKEVTFKPNQEFHYDESLVTSEDAPAFGLQVANWQTK